jgi:hypothetical protein
MTQGPKGTPIWMSLQIGLNHDRAQARRCRRGTCKLPACVDFSTGGGEIPVNTQQTLTRSSERTSADATVDRAAARI